MKATLEFDLPEEQSEFDLCCDATKLSIVISELNNELRNHLKYEAHPEWDTKTVDEIQQILFDLKQDYDIRESL
jgi:hypothetical protein